MLPAVELKAMLLVGQRLHGAESWIGRLEVSVWGCLQLVANVSIRGADLGQSRMHPQYVCW